MASTSDIGGSNMTNTVNTGGALATGPILDPSQNQVATDSTSNLFVAPYIGVMYADASGQVGVLEQTTVTITDIDKIFNVTLLDGDAMKIIGAFTVTDLDRAATEAGDISAASVQVDISGAKKADFVAALAQAVVDASDGSVSLTNWLKAETKLDVERLLSFDTLANLLEGSVLSSFGIALDASGGANKMYTTIENGAAGLRRLLFTQLTENRVETYAPAAGTDPSGERIKIMNFLPFLKGDKLAFVFDVYVGQYTPGANGVNGEHVTAGAALTRKIQDASPASELTAQSYITGAAAAGGAFAETGAVLTISKPSMRRVAVQVQLSTGGSAFNTSRVAAMDTDGRTYQTISLA